ncbi:MAG: lipid-A-disaccharide synthase [Gammaproteobacteria bacterium]|nr:lipid-A-disaccharide synthase [Gammaproteobacteria bacterium]
MRIALVAGEPSGDLLGAGLMEAIRRRVPDSEFLGIGGPRMAAAGCHGLYPMERLSVMGLVEVARRLPELLLQRRRLARQLVAAGPAVFVGIDAPDYNLGLERRLRRAGVPTAHYVSPSVWAWRAHRVKAIRKSTDLMLTLFPFEAEFYERAGVPVRFVGHPMADAIPLDNPPEAARRRLGLAQQATWVALLPGSRGSEIRRLAPAMLAAAHWMARARPGLRFVIPLVNGRTRGLVEQALGNAAPQLDVTLLDGRSREAMAAADGVLLASGTATLEALLIKRPMVVAYRVHPLTYRLVKPMLRVERYALPNLLAGRALVPEFIQDDVVPERLGAELLRLMEDEAAATAYRHTAEAIHLGLRRDADARAAEAVLGLAAARARH